MSTEPGKLHERVSLITQVSVLALLMVGWTRPLNSIQGDHPMAKTLAEDSAYMMKLYREQSPAAGRAMQVDLADARQYQFVMNRLSVTGKTPASSPYFFQRLAEIRAEALARKADKDSVTPTSTTGWCTHFLFLGKGTRVNSNMQYAEDYPVISCAGGAAYIYADVSAYNSNSAGSENFLLQTSAGEDYSGGTNFDSVRITPQLPAGAGRILNTDSIVFVDDPARGTHFSYTMEDTVVPLSSPSIVINHPVRHPFIPNNGNNIVLCQERGNQYDGDCDYVLGRMEGSVFRPWRTPFTGQAAPASINPWTPDNNTYLPFDAAGYQWDHLYVPMVGGYSAGCKITGYAYATARMVKAVSGGMCIMESDFSSKLQTTSTDPNAATYKFLADFTNRFTGTSCTVSTLLNDNVVFSVSIKATTECGPQHTSETFMRLGDRLRFRNSCLAEGTNVVRADGTSVRIEEVKKGDKILADDKGLALTVMGITQGVEGAPLVVLKDDKGREVRMTERHPVLDVSGKVLAAVDVQAGDRLAAKGGPALITSVERLPYTGQVYNLTLGTPDELAKAGIKAGTLFANGFLVGDEVMQDQLTTPQPRSDDVLASLPKSWHQDYHNALELSRPSAR